MTILFLIEILTCLKVLGFLSKQDTDNETKKIILHYKTASAEGIEKDDKSIGIMIENGQWQISFEWPKQLQCR